MNVVFLQEALDCFCCCLAKPEKRLPLSEAIAAKLNIVQTTVRPQNSSRDIILNNIENMFFCCRPSIICVSINLKLRSPNCKSKLVVQPCVVVTSIPWLFKLQLRDSRLRTSRQTCWNVWQCVWRTTNPCCWWARQVLAKHRRCSFWRRKLDNAWGWLTWTNRATVATSWEGNDINKYQQGITESYLNALFHVDTDSSQLTWNTWSDLSRTNSSCCSIEVFRSQTTKSSWVTFTH